MITGPTQEERRRIREDANRSSRNLFLFLGAVAVTSFVVSCLLVLVSGAAFNWGAVIITSVIVFVLLCATMSTLFIKKYF